MKCFRTECTAAAPYATLYSVNAKGRPGVWACNAHRLERDSELDAIVEAVGSKRCEACRAVGMIHCSDPTNCDLTIVLDLFTL